MPLLQPFVTPGLVILGAGIGAVVASPPAVPEWRDAVPTAVHQPRPDGAAAADVPTGAVPPVVAGLSEAAVVPMATPELITLTPPPIEGAAQEPSSFSPTG